MAGSDKPIPWTAEQRDGIEATGTSLLVSAAAGSGKTAVLAERCAYLVCDAPDPCEVSELLVVTFTEAAAAEMKSRIAAALRKRFEADGERDPRLRVQIAQIDRMQVGTLHGFCSRLLRQHFHLIGLDPAFTILDADEARLLRGEVIREQFAERYEADETGLFQRFVDAYGDGNDDGLRARVASAHELLRSLVSPAAWMASARERLAEAGTKPLADCALGRELAVLVRGRIDALRRTCDEAIALVNETPRLAKYGPPLGALHGQLDDWSTSFGDGDFDALAAAVGRFESPRKPTIKDAPAEKAAVDTAFDAVRVAMTKGELCAVARFSSAQWAEGLAATEPYAGLFLDLVDEFAARYAAAKERNRGVDFGDLEQLALRVLRSGNGDGPSAVARLYHRLFRYVLVDEYQDINEVQDAILRLVSHECLAGRRGAVPNLFCVGDVKQSIYGFRLAEPAQFLARYERFKSAEGCGGRVIDLQQNFRSRAPLLAALNALFARLMTREAVDIEYDASHELRPGATYPEPDRDGTHFGGAPVELHLLPDAASREAEAEEDDGGGGEAGDDDAAGDQDRTDREAAFVAHRIRQLLGCDGSAAAVVATKEGPRAIAPRDIVVLLRTAKRKADQFADALARHGIAAHRDGGSGYFESTEVRDLLALLDVLDNQRQDVPLAAVLRSPLAGLAEAETSLARIRLAYRKESGGPQVPFHEAVRRYASEQTGELAERLRAFLARLTRWRQMARQRPLADLLWRVYDESGYLAYVGGLAGGEQRVANLLELHERARQFGTFARRGLHRFIRLLDRLRREGGVGQPSLVGEAEDAVRVMTVHRSKGLEFPVVFLPDLGKGINLADTKGSILLDRHAFLGLEVADEARRVRYPSLASMLVRQRLRRQALAEELRVLYVAATRAREHLILVGTCGSKAAAGWQGRYAAHAGALPTDVVLGAGCVLDWVGPAAAAAGAAHFRVHHHDSAEVSAWSADAAGKPAADEPGAVRQRQLAGWAPLDPAPPASAAVDALIARLGRRYAHEALASLAAAESVTGWVKRQRRGTAPLPPADAGLSLPVSLQGEAPLFATDRGAATHRVLERLDFARPCAGADLREQIDGLVAARVLTAARAAAVDVASIEWFVGGEVGQLVRANAATLRREMPFNLAVEPGRLAPGTVAAGPLDQVMLRGTIDLLIPQAGGFVLVDYKTDRVDEAGVDARAAFYEPQVALYREAVERIARAPVSAVHLVFLSARIIRTIGAPPAGG